MDTALILRLSGAVLIILSAVLAAVSCIESFKSSETLMLSLSSAMLLMKRELSDRLTPLPELLELCAGESEGRVRSFFEELCGGLCSLGETEMREMWSRAASEHLSSLPAAVFRETAALGSVLGSCDAEMQIKAISSVMSTADAAVSAFEKSFPEKRRLLGGICLSLCGFAIIILL